MATDPDNLYKVHICPISGISDMGFLVPNGANFIFSQTIPTRVIFTSIGKKLTSIDRDPLFIETAVTSSLKGLLIFKQTIIYNDMVFKTSRSSLKF